jgi:hypothetical protein
MLDRESLTFDQVSEDIYAEVVSGDERALFPQGTICKSVAGVVHVAFFVDIRYTDDTGYRWPISHDDIARWKVDLSAIEDIATNEHCVIPVQKWNRIGRWGVAYQYPDFDRSWTSILLNRRELEHVDLNGLPLVMIPEPDCVLVTGDRDYWGIRAIYRATRFLNPSPRTVRPLLRAASGEWTSCDESRLSALSVLGRRFRA